MFLVLMCKLFGSPCDRGVTQPALQGTAFEDGPYSGLLQALFVVTMLLVTIVLLNLLIALMGDSYQRPRGGARCRGGALNFHRMRANSPERKSWERCLLFFAINKFINCGRFQP